MEVRLCVCMCVEKLKDGGSRRTTAIIIIIIMIIIITGEIRG